MRVRRNFRDAVQKLEELELPYGWRSDKLLSCFFVSSSLVLTLMIGEENLVDQWGLKEREEASSFKRIGRGDQRSGKLSGYIFSLQFSKYQSQRVCTCHTCVHLYLYLWALFELNVIIIGLSLLVILTFGILYKRTDKKT